MIYLASTSPRRKKILKHMGISFKAISPDYEEKTPAGISPSQIVMRHALGKALSVIPKIRSGMVLGCDTIVYFRKKIIGKPKNLKNAFRILGTLQGRTHTVYTGVAIFCAEESTICSKKLFYEKTLVTLKKMSGEEIKRYFRKINPLDKAGAYAIQSERHGIVEKVKGSFLNAVGLPVERLEIHIKKN